MPCTGMPWNAHELVYKSCWSFHVISLLKRIVTWRWLGKLHVWRCDGCTALLVLCAVASQCSRSSLHHHLSFSQLVPICQFMFQGGPWATIWANMGEQKQSIVRQTTSRSLYPSPGVTRITGKIITNIILASYFNCNSVASSIHIYLGSHQWSSGRIDSLSLEAIRCCMYKVDRATANCLNFWSFG